MIDSSKEPALMFLSLAMFGVALGLSAVVNVTAQGTLTGAVKPTDSGVPIDTQTCMLALRAVTDTAIRVRCGKAGAIESTSLVLVPQVTAPAFKVSRDEHRVTLATAKMKAIFDRSDIYPQAAAVTFRGSTLMRPLVMDLPQDDQALRQRADSHSVHRVRYEGGRIDVAVASRGLR